MYHVEWYHVCWPRLTAKRVEPVVSISWASCLHCYHDRLKCSPFAFTHAVWWWRHCWTAHAWWPWSGLASPTRETADTTYTVHILYWQCHFSSTNLCQTKWLFCLQPWVLLKLTWNHTALQGSVGTDVVVISFNAHCSLLIVVTTSQIDGNLSTIFKVIAKTFDLLIIVDTV